MSHLLHVSLNCLEMLNGRDLYHTRPRPSASLWNTVQQIPCRLSTSQLLGRLSTSAFPFHGRLSMPAFPFHVPEHPTPFAVLRPCQLDFCWSFGLFFWAGCLFNLCSFYIRSAHTFSAPALFITVRPGCRPKHLALVRPYLFLLGSLYHGLARMPAQISHYHGPARMPAHISRIAGFGTPTPFQTCSSSLPAFKSVNYSRAMHCSISKLTRPRESPHFL